MRFASVLERGGRVAVFARGGDIHVDAFGDLTVDMPFSLKVLDSAAVASLTSGFAVQARGAAKFIAFYTPPMGL
jgi:hypothetical protein